MKVSKIVRCITPILLILLTSRLLVAQEIKAVKISDVEEYINKSKGPVVINFWASWCGPCLEEMPVLQEAIRKNEASKIQLVLVSLDNRAFFESKMKAFIADKKWQGTILWLDETNADVFCPKVDKSWTGAIPATLFLNNAKNHRKFQEKQLAGEEFAKEISQLLR